MPIDLPLQEMEVLLFANDASTKLVYLLSTLVLRRAHNMALWSKAADRSREINVSGLLLSL